MYVLCESCEYFIPKDDFPGYGECRKLAPRPTIKSTEALITPEAYSAIWANVRTVDGCFEGKEKLKEQKNKVVDPNDTPSRAMSSSNSVFANPFDKMVKKKQKKPNSGFDGMVKKKQK